MGAARMSMDDPRNNRVMAIQVNTRKTGSAGIEIVIMRRQDGKRVWYQVELWSEDCFDRVIQHEYRSMMSAALRSLNILFREYTL